jgi:aspartate/methionine/tyrosine aminotransferase
MKPLNSTATAIKESIFSQMTALAREHKAINLSQGFPNFEGPSFIRDALKEAVSMPELGQYAPMTGIPLLLEELSHHFKHNYNLDYDKFELTVTNGATEAIMVGSLALLEKGDEVILFEPFYDSYPVAAELAGATVKVVTLKAPDFHWDLEELEKAFSHRTKLVYLNNPHNPTGRVFTKEELSELSRLVKKYDAYVLSDEVYEFLTFDEHKHIPFATLPEMRERTLTIGSAGKTFGHTGLKVGWLAAPKELTHACRMVHQFNVFSVNSMAQYAVAMGLKERETYIPEFQKLYLEKRDLLDSILTGAGLNPLKSQGTYFTVVPIPHLALENGHDDISFCRHLIEKHQVATIPPSAFYRKSDEGSKYLRFCFAKSDELLKKAGVYLKSLEQR